MNLRIVSNYSWRSFRYRYEVPKKVLESEFDWTNRDHEESGSYEDGFFQYRGTWYHLSQFSRGGVEGWDGSHADSFFSGILIRLSPDGESFQVATYTS